MPSDELTPPVTTGLDILAEMDAWRTAHPTAILAEIEAALDQRLSALRRQMLPDAVAKSPEADWSACAPDQRPLCPRCGVPLQPRGKRTRKLRSAGGDITLDRTYGVCPKCGEVVFPLDDELALLPSRLSPTLHGWLVRLASYLPFAQAAALMSEFAHVPLGEGSAQRLTYAAGTSVVVEQTLEADRIVLDMPPPCPGPACLLLSADGEMVPLVGGE